RQGAVPHVFAALGNDRGSRHGERRHAARRTAAFTRKGERAALRNPAGCRDGPAKPASVHGTPGAGRHPRHRGRWLRAGDEGRDLALVRAHERSARILPAYLSRPPLNTAVPATSTSAPALTERRAVSGFTPPSTSRSIGLPSASMARRRAA